MRLLGDMRSALGLLTVVPAGVIPPEAKPAAWFPWVGWGFGVLAVGIASAASLVITGELGSLMVGVIILAAWAVSSRMMHWDGLADVGDAFWGGHSPERRLEIMRDSRVGSFGVVTVVLVAVAQVVAIAMVFASRDWWGLAAAPVLGRFSAAMGLWGVAPARKDGLGASLAARPTVSEIVFSALAVGLLLLVPSPIRAMVVFGAAGVAFAMPRVLGHRMGGMTGDVLGASIMLVETAVLFVAALTGA